MGATTGFFLVIEGLDGSGKTVVSHRLLDVLERANPGGNVKLTFEPHDASCSGLFIRQVLSRNRRRDDRTLALAFAANRADHLFRDIVPFLNGGEKRIVICDRYYLSSLVYQTADISEFDEVMNLNAQALRPNLTVFMNASDTTCYQRIRDRAEHKDLFESNLRSTRTKYLKAIDFLRERGDTVAEVNADGSIEEVLNEILAVLEAHGPRWLQTQLLLPMDSGSGLSRGMVSTDDIPGANLKDMAESVFANLLVGDVNIEDIIAKARNSCDQAVLYLSEDSTAALFVDYLRVSGYVVIGELPWSETKALDLEYSMPLEITQRGIALFLTRRQSYSLLTKTVFDVTALVDDPEIPMLADFIVCFDFSNEHVALRQFERELVVKRHVSPTVVLVSRINIRDLILAIVMVQLAEMCIPDYSALGSRNRIHDAITEWHLTELWTIAVQITTH